MLSSTSEATAIALSDFEVRPSDITVIVPGTDEAPLAAAAMAETAPPGCSVWRP